MSKPWSPRIHLQPYWDGDVYISLYCVLFARKDRKRKVPGCSLKAGPLFPYLIWLRNDLVNACAHTHCPPTAGVLKFTVHNRTKVPPQGGEKAVLWQQQSDSPRHCCLPGPLQHENHGTPWPCVFCTQPKGSVTALLASPCQCWAKHQRGAAGQRHTLEPLPELWVPHSLPAPLLPPGPAIAETPSVPLGSSGKARQRSCNSSLGWRRGCKGNKPGEIFSQCYVRWALAAVISTSCNHDFFFHQSGVLHSYLHGLCQKLDLSQNKEFKRARKALCKWKIILERGIITLKFNWKV